MNNTSVTLSGSDLIIRKGSLSSLEIESCACNNHYIKQGSNNTIGVSLERSSKKSLFYMLKLSTPDIVFDENKKKDRDLLYSALTDKYKLLQEKFDSYARKAFKFYDSLFDFQKESLRVSLNRKNNLISFEQGLGKSVTALALSLLDRYYNNETGKTVIICPNVCKWNWFEELVKWGISEDEITFVDSKKTINSKREKFIIINYSLVKKYTVHLFRREISHIIVDECHYIKNIVSQRHKSVRRVYAKQRCRMTMLSGTPIKNRIEDMFAYLSMTNHPLGRSYKEFKRRFCVIENTKFGDKVVGVRNIGKFRLLTSNFIIRKTKEQVANLPDKIYNRFYFEFSEYRKEYNQALKEVEAKTNRNEIEMALHTLNIITTKAKIKHIRDLAHQIYYDDGKVIIFCSYREPIKILEDYFGNECVVITGSTSSDKKRENINKFKKDPHIKFFVGQTTAAGIGINLQVSSNVIIANFPLTASELEQAIDRSHRTGQMKTVNVYLTMCKGTIDVKLYNLVMSKMRDTSKTIDGKSLDIDFNNLSKELLKSLSDEDREDRIDKTNLKEKLYE